MMFSSSPVVYPANSSPPMFPKKKRLFRTFEDEAHKKPRLMEDHEALVEGNGRVSAKKHTAVFSVERPCIQKEYRDLGSPSVSAEVTHDIDELMMDARRRSPSLPPQLSSTSCFFSEPMITAETCSGDRFKIPMRSKTKALSYEQTVAQRSVTAAGRATKSYYGIDIHDLVDQARQEQELEKARRQVEAEQSLSATIERPQPRDSNSSKEHQPNQMWTEKYRAKKFTELVGDERTHRSVLKWMKAWDTIVFPHTAKTKPKPKKIFDERNPDTEWQHRKILLLTGPPGLGKTTLAHVCAKQAGYEVLEINASDDRSRDVVRGRIKDALGTENVRGIKEHGKARRAGRPVCVVVDEVDGVVTGSGGSGGEGGFMKALVDLVQLDQRNSSSSAPQASKTQKSDRFRMLRPLILICNDVYAPSLRPLRSSSVAEILHVRKPALDKIIVRMKHVFEKESIQCDSDAVRRLCESSWGLGTRKQNNIGGRGAGEGDIRGVLVQGEWVAHKFRAIGASEGVKLTRKWVEAHLGHSQASTSQKGLGRGGLREVVDRIFLEGAGLPNVPIALSANDTRLVSESQANPVGVADLKKRAAITALREMIETCGDHDRMMTDCFATYPNQVYQDDANLSKPNAGYDWLHFHDCLSHRIFSGQEWELNPYLSTSACGFHHLFAAVDKGEKNWHDDKAKDADEETQSHPFSGPRADFAAYEAEKQNRTVLTEFQSALSGPLLRIFSSTDTIATELIPSLSRMMAPEVKPVVIGGSGGMGSVASVRKDTEKTCVSHAVRILGGLNVSFEKVRIEVEGGAAYASAGFVYRMEPPLDILATYHLGKIAGTAPALVRYAIRQVLDQELRREKILQDSVTRHARSSALDHGVDVVEGHDDKENVAPKGKVDTSQAILPGVKRDFFGRIVNDVRPLSADRNSKLQKPTSSKDTEQRVWVSFHEGYSNAVRKPVSLKELIDSFELP